MEEMNECPVFHPSMEEFEDFASYIDEVVEPKCASIGLCKIVPPANWFTTSYEDVQFEIPTPVSQHVAGKKGVFTVDLVERKSMNVATFRTLVAQLTDCEPPETATPHEIERKFWKGLRSTMTAPVYGADIVGSLFRDNPAHSWNLNDLKTILRKIDLPGVTQAMMYFGMWKAMFALHTEDMDLYSINYLHYGKPKFWYGIAPQHAKKLERVAASMFPESRMHCAHFLRHKTSLISPSKLKEFQIPFVRAIQRQGEFVITFPGAYHEGFNTGYNIAEAVNFATFRWIPKGLQATVCKCRPDSVLVHMDSFIGNLFHSGKPFHQNCPWLSDEFRLFSCKCGKTTTSEDMDKKVKGDIFQCTQCRIWVHTDCVSPTLPTVEKDDARPLLCHRCSIYAAPTKRKIDALDNNSTLTLRKKFRLTQSTRVIIQRFDGNLCEGIVVSVDGEKVRLHFKGESSSKDEWIAKDSESIVRILPISHTKTHMAVA